MRQRQDQSFRTIRFGYAASALAFSYAAVSFYWALGGRSGLRTLGAPLEKLAYSHSVVSIILIWIAVAVKVFCGLLAIFLVRGRRYPQYRRLVLSLGWAVAVILIVYGALQVAAETLVELGILHLNESIDWYSLKWHLLVWDPWFLVWGVMQALSCRYSTL